jgi:hypothetical protein
MVPINASLIPFVAGALKIFEERRSWHDDTEYEQAFNAFVELEICMTRLCVDDLIESNDRLYRMLDAAIFGTAYEVTTSDPLVVEPIIWPTHTLEIADPLSIMGRMDDMSQLLQNALNGTSTTNYTDVPGIRELLANLITAVEAGGASDADMLAQLIEIGALLA